METLTLTLCPALYSTLPFQYPCCILHRTLCPTLALVSLCTDTNLCGGAQAAWLFAGAHHQQEAPLVTLVIERSGQADLPGLLLDAEEAAGVDQQAVADRLLLERKGKHRQESAEQRGSGLKR